MAKALAGKGKEGLGTVREKGEKGVQVMLEERMLRKLQKGVLSYEPLTLVSKGEVPFFGINIPSKLLLFV